MTSSSTDSSQPNIIRAHVFISGRVQGVGYRATTADTAQSLELKGWVRNLRDRRVEAVFEGDRATVAEMLRWCHKGPPAAIVDQVEINYETPEGLKEFQVLV
jgi:acylphosphatase